jgi:hypothetical protein
MWSRSLAYPSQLARARIAEALRLSRTPVAGWAVNEKTLSKPLCELWKGAVVGRSLVCRSQHSGVILEARGGLPDAFLSGLVCQRHKGALGSLA